MQAKRGQHTEHASRQPLHPVKTGPSQRRVTALCSWPKIQHCNSQCVKKAWNGLGVALYFQVVVSNFMGRGSQTFHMNFVEQVSVKGAYLSMYRPPIPAQPVASLYFTREHAHSFCESHGENQEIKVKLSPQQDKLCHISLFGGTTPVCNCNHLLNALSIVFSSLPLQLFL